MMIHKTKFLAILADYLEAVPQSHRPYCLSSTILHATWAPDTQPMAGLGGPCWAN